MRRFITGKLSQRLSLILLTFGLVVLPGQATIPVLAQEGPALMFIENVGQFSGEAIRFQVQSSQATLSLAENALWFTFLEQPTTEVQAQNTLPTDPGALISNLQSSTPQRAVNLKLSFLDANPQPSLEPFNRLETHVSYFVGNDPANWRSDVPVWGGVRYIDLYPGVDLEITSENGQLVQRWVVKADVAVAETSPLSAIRWRVEGADALSLENENQLRLATAIGDFILTLPQSVDLNGAPLDLSTTPEVNGLEIASPFTSARSSTDLPAYTAAAADLLYSTYLGGPGYLDSARKITADSAGHAYLTGLAYPGFPTTPGVFDPTVGGVYDDVFIAKVNPTGTELVYATFLGGSDFEAGHDIKLDPVGNAFIAGITTSPDFPTTPGAFDSSLAGESDAFVAKLNTDGTSLLYSTLFGGNNLDFGLSLALDQAGHAYVAGFTQAADFPTTAAGYWGGWTDAFAVKVAPDGSNLLYSLLLGGADSDYGYAIAAEADGNAYVTGYTSSANFVPIPAALDTTLSGDEAFLVKLNPAGETVYATFLGGSASDRGYGVAVDTAGRVYITGFTDSYDFPVTPGVADSIFNPGDGGDAFVAQIAPNGASLVYATFLGGSHNDSGEDVIVDAEGSAYVTGTTSSVNFPTTAGAYQATCNGCNQTYPIADIFVTKLHPNGALAYSTFLGGGNYEWGYGLALSEINQVYLAGDTRSTDFPVTPGAFDSTLNGDGDAIVAKLQLRPDSVVTPPTPVPTHTCAPTPLGTITVGNEPRGIAIDSARQRVYVANYSSDSVSVIDSNTNTVIQTIPGITYANGIAHDTLHNVLWVTNLSTDQVTPIQVNADATAFTPLPAVNVGDMPWGVTYDPVHNYIYVGNGPADSISVIDAETHAVVTTLTGSNFLRPYHLAANPVTGKVYVVNFGGPTHNVTVLDGTTVSKVISLYDSKEPYGLAIDETRNLVYVATVEPHRIVVIGPRGGVPDQFLGWAAFHRGFGNPRRPVPLRAIAVNPTLGPAGDGGHIWATTTTGDGSELNQALFIPKGWGGGFHFPIAQNVDIYPADGLAIDRATNRVYVSSGFAPGTVTVIGDHATLCPDAFTKIASAEGQAGQPAGEDSDQIGVELWDYDQEGETPASNDVNQDGTINILDLAYVAARYGGDDLTIDLNADGKIDILDLVIIVNNYGQ